MHSGGRRRGRSIGQIQYGAKGSTPSAVRKNRPRHQPRARDKAEANAGMGNKQEKK